MAHHANTTAPAPPTDRERLRKCFDSVLRKIDDYLGERDEQRRDELREQLEPLCVMRRIEHKVQIAWGGPEYGFKVYYDPACQVWAHGVFYWADWFKYEDESLTDAEVAKVVEAYALNCLVE